MYNNNNVILRLELSPGAQKIGGQPRYSDYPQMTNFGWFDMGKQDDGSNYEGMEKTLF